MQCDITIYAYDIKIKAMTLKFMHMTLKFMHTTLEFMHMTLKLKQYDIKIINKHELWTKSFTTLPKIWNLVILFSVRELYFGQMYFSISA